MTSKYPFAALPGDELSVRARDSASCARPRPRPDGAKGDAGAPGSRCTVLLLWRGWDCGGRGGKAKVG